MIFSVEEKAFIMEHLETDASALMLNPPAKFKDRIKPLIGQIKARQKVKKKLPDWYKNSDLIFPPAISSEQSSSDITAAFKSKLLDGNTLFDLTGGMGIDTLAFAKTIEKVGYIEPNPSVFEAFEHNQKIWDFPNIQTFQATAESFLENFQSDKKVSFYLDPSRRNDAKEKVFRFEDCLPNVADLLPFFEKFAEKVLVKASPMIDLKLGENSLKSVTDIYVVAVKNDVKEVLFLMDFSTSERQESNIHTYNLGNENSEYFKFSKTQEKEASSSFSAIQGYLYIPNNAILKAGAFNAVGDYFGVHKIGSQTHLYTSDELVTEWPGRILQVMETSVTKKNIKKLIPETHAMAISKNHPLSAPEILKKFSFQDGGENYLIGFRDAKNKTQIILGKPLPNG